MRKARDSQRGIGLAETLVAIALLGTAITTFVTALSTGSIAVGVQEEGTTAQRVLQSQMEYVKSLSYNATTTTYPALPTPEGYSVAISVSPVPATDATIQAVTVAVYRNGQLVITADDYKVDR